MVKIPQPIADAVAWGALLAEILGFGERSRDNRIVEVEQPKRTVEAKVVAGDH